MRRRRLIGIYRGLVKSIRCRGSKSCYKIRGGGSERPNKHGRLLLHASKLAEQGVEYN